MDLLRWLIALARPNLYAKLSRLSKRLRVSEKPTVSRSWYQTIRELTTRRVLESIVVDASVTLSWCFPDEQTDSLTSVLDRLQSGEKALVPAFWTVEILNTLLVGERRGRITAEQKSTFLDTLKMMKPVLDYATLEQIAGPVQIICRDYRLTPDDALYIELAQRWGCPLATLDQPQRDATVALAFAVYDFGLNRP